MISKEEHGLMEQSAMHMQQMLDARLYFQGTRVDNITAELALSAIDRFLADRELLGGRRVFFTNVHSIHLSRKDKELREHINSADLVLPDGSGLKIAGKLLGHPILENLNGTDFIPKVLERSSNQKRSIYLFGGGPGIAEKCENKLRIMYPGLNIVGHRHGHFHESEEECILAEINAKSPDILLVALGSPLQEKWITRNSSILCAGVSFAVGGLFDFLSGEYGRAPAWVRRAGVEFIYRFATNPRSKWRRVFVELPIFLFLILCARCLPRRFADLGIRPTKEKQTHMQPRVWL